jgi:glycosyltransferase involved in cell wall biosynthesis
MNSRLTSRRVLCVIDSIMLGGGAERLLISLLPPLRARGIDVDVAALDSLAGDLGSEIEDAGGRMIRLDLLHRWSSIEGVAKVARALKRGAYDLVWGHLYFGNMYGAIAGRIANVPSVITLHNAGEFQNIDQRNAWARSRNAIERTIGGTIAARRVAVSQAVKDAYARETNWRDIDVIRNGVPIAHLPKPLTPDERANVRKELGFASDAFVLSVAARLAPEKGYSTLIDALGILKKRGGPAVKLVIFGQGGLVTSLTDQAKALGIDDDVIFRGAVPQLDLFDAIMASDAFVLSSWREPFGIAAAEAMALGVPVIVSGVDGLLELAGSDGAALLVPPRDADRLADAIARVRSDETLRKDLSTRGRDRVRSEFDIEKVADLWADLFRSLPL